jgi:hypothetical protein
VLAKAFAQQGIKYGVQVNSIVLGAVMTGRRRSLLEHWAPAHNMGVEEATSMGVFFSACAPTGRLARDWCEPIPTLP